MVAVASRPPAAEPVPPRRTAGVDWAVVAAETNAAAPAVCRLEDGRLAAVFEAVLPDPAAPGRPPLPGIALRYSADEGHTWSGPQRVWSGPGSAARPAVAQLPGGRLLCTFSQVAPELPEPLLGLWSVSSEDLGKTWNEWRRCSPEHASGGALRRWPDGRWALGVRRRNMAEAGAANPGTILLSADAGATWGAPLELPSGRQGLGGRTDWVALGDGALGAVVEGSARSMGWSTSPDGGRTWLEVEPLGMAGQNPFLLASPDGALVLAAAGARERLWVSRDRAATWGRPMPVDIGPGRRASLVALKDGSMLVVYDQTNGGVRARRFRVEGWGIEWLPWEAPAWRSVALSQPGWAGPEVRLGGQAGQWRMEGARRTVQLNERDLQLIVGPVPPWKFEPSAAGDVVVWHQGVVMPLRLADAGRREVTHHETGFQRGLEVRLSDFSTQAAPLDLELRLRVSLEGEQEDLVCELIASDKNDRVLGCSWPSSLASDSSEATVLPYRQGMLLPRDWPAEVTIQDTFAYSRGLSMPWWGHLQGTNALLAILETPWDGGFRFTHPAGGPTRLATVWRPSLGALGYPRRVRFRFLDGGGHVELAKAYRQWSQEHGQFVSLKEKTARNPRVAGLVGTPIVKTSVLFNDQPDSKQYVPGQPAANHRLVLFAERAAALRRLSARGVNRAYVHLDGWGVWGYDNLHPDVLPPSPEAGGWDGMRQLSATCRELGYLFVLHDQYRDFYVDALSYDPRLTIQDATGGNRPSHNTWDGGWQSVLCPSLTPGYLRRNYRQILAQGVILDGAYLDVFAVVPPDECQSPDHPVTREQCLRDWGACFDSIRSWGGIASSEEPSDWAIPKIELVHHGPYPFERKAGRWSPIGIPVPLFNLVYHDALITPWFFEAPDAPSSVPDPGFLLALANAGLPYLSLEPSAEELAKVRTVCALNERLAFQELTGHALLDAAGRRQRFTYADGTVITIDLESGTWEIAPTLVEPAAPR